MKDVQIVSEPYPPLAWTETVARGINQHNVAMTGCSDYYPVGLFIKGTAGQIVGGLLGDIWGGWLHVGSLWVEKSLRQQGYGKELMTRAERYALGKSCTDAFLRTGSFEARPLYEKLGYHVYGELKDHPIKPHSRYFMTKHLESDNEGHPHILELEIAMEPYASASHVSVIREGIHLHAAAAIGLPENSGSQFGYFLRDDSGEIRGGAIGNLWGDWMFLALLWVDTPLRGSGYAGKLLAAAEEHAIAERCSSAFLDTLNARARPVYENLGYRVFAELKDHPKSHNRYWLSKRLVSKS
jgi:GNAT superfamily N-acetyltransferase